MAILLKSSYDYVAFKEVETVNRWLEFRKQNGNIIINVAVDELCIIKNLLVTDRYNFSYVMPVDFVINEEVFYRKLLDTSIKFINEIERINAKLLNTKLVSELTEKVQMIKKM